MTSTQDDPAAIGGIPTLALAARQIREGSLTAVALVERILARITATEPIVHAYAYLDAEGARQAAKTADLEITRHGPKSPLHGIPLGVKDLLEVRGMPTTAGSQLFKDHRSTQDADVVATLRAAGAIFLGKQHTHQFGVGVDFPPSRTPWDPTRYAGGSTIGGAVSLAAGSCVAAIGTDGGGSIRKPAAINGLVGLKPTLGAVDTGGIFPGAASVDHIGWLTRTVMDSRILWQTISGHQAADDSQHSATLRVGCIESFFTDVNGDIEHCARAALDALQAAGAEITWIKLPIAQKAGAVHGEIVGYELYQRHNQWMETHPEGYDPRTLHCLQGGAGITRARVEAAYQARQEITAAFEEVFRSHGVDVLCSPTVAIPSEPLVGMDAEKTLPNYIRLTTPFNLTGEPAISVPIGTANHGLPVGLQIAAPLHAEERLLDAAERVEALHLWNYPAPPALTTIG